MTGTPVWDYYLGLKMQIGVCWGGGVSGDGGVGDTKQKNGQGDKIRGRNGPDLLETQ